MKISRTCSREEGWSVFSAYRCDHCLFEALMPGSGWSEDRLASELSSYEERGRMLNPSDERYYANERQTTRVEMMARYMRAELRGEP